MLLWPFVFLLVLAKGKRPDEILSLNPVAPESKMLPK
jgi:hypothetical protein